MFHFLGSVIFQPTFPYVHHRFANSTPEKTRPIQTTVSGGRIVNLHITMNSTKVQNPRHKMQVALLAEPKTPLESSVFI